MTSIRCILLLSPMAITAQDSLKYSLLTIGAGFNNIANKDEFQSPYTYRGNNFFLNANFTRVFVKGMYIIDLAYSTGQIKSVVSPKADNKLLLSNYDYLWSIKSKKLTNKLSPFIGLGVHTLFTSANYLPKLESSQNYLSANAFLTLSGSVFYYPSKKSRLNLQFGLSLLGFVYRPDFEINGSTLKTAAFIGKSNQTSIKIEYQYQLAKKIFLTTTFNYAYFKFNEPRPIIIMQNGLSIGVRKKF